MNIKLHELGEGIHPVNFSGSRKSLNVVEDTANRVIYGFVQVGAQKVFFSPTDSIDLLQPLEDAL